jgi:hypothetical protein
MAVFRLRSPITTDTVSQIMTIYRFGILVHINTTCIKREKRAKKKVSVYMNWRYVTKFRKLIESELTTTRNYFDSLLWIYEDVSKSFRTESITK